jgi:hypothetical protein
MNLFDCVSAAEKDIYNARSYLETRSAVFRVCDNIFSAMMWAMEAWLIGKGHSPRNGWDSIRAQFFQLAPAGIKSPVSYCVAEAVMLNYDREGGEDHKEKPIAFERWEKMVFGLIDKAEQCIVAIEKDIGCSKKQLARLWLYKKFHKE